MLILDFFIKENALLQSSELYKHRIITAMLIFLGLIPVCTFVLMQMGYFQNEFPLLFFIQITTCLLIMKFSGNLNYVLFALLAIGCFTIYEHIIHSGMITSYNIKWFVVLMFFTAFINSRWLFPFCIVILCILLYVYHTMHSGMMEFNSEAVANEIFIDHILFLVVVSIAMYLFFKHMSLKNKKLQEHELLLVERTNQLIQTNQELERFAHVASHDIKTPLRNILSFTSLLEREMNGNLSEKAEDYIKYIKSSGENLYTFVDDILNYSKATNNIEDAKELDLNRVIISIKKLLDPSLSGKKAGIQVKNPLPKIHAQRTIMLLLFKNLIENGLKYNDSKEPKVSISSVIQNGNVKFKIEDNGIGIHERFHEKIFEPYTRLHGDKKYQGSGLGLSLCKKLMQEYDGKISMDSALGEGTKFTLSFPKSILVED